MLKLTKPSDQAERVPLSGVSGAAIHVRVATAIDHEAALAAARDMMRRMIDGRQTEALYGVAPADVAHYASLDSATGLTELVYAVELARFCLAAWEGVCDESGAPIAPNQQSVAMLFLDPVHLATFRGAALKRVHEALAEGNGSAPLPNGGGAAEQTIAGDAASKDSPVPAANAAMAANFVPNGFTRH